MQDFKRVLNLNERKRRNKQFDSFNWLSNDPEHVRNVIQWHYTISLSDKKFFRKFLMTSLHVICGWAPQSKIFATPMHQSTSDNHGGPYAFSLVFEKQ